MLGSLQKKLRQSLHILEESEGEKDTHTCSRYITKVVGTHVSKWAGCHMVAKEKAMPKGVRDGVIEGLGF